ncbi:MAG: prolyl oligopeptidase family serine peptidase [bacterium]
MGKTTLICLSGAFVILMMNGYVYAQEQEDPYLWLEEIEGEKALDWVRQQNTASLSELAESEEFKTIQSQLLNILDSEEKIPYVSKIGEFYYNFWRDEKHPRGVWRRTTLEKYRQDKPDWEIVLDLDVLAEEEKENWVWHGANVLQPEERFCMIALSRGGSDADVKRELDLKTKSFVDKGYALPEAKSRFAWRGPDSAYVATDFGPASLTTSGYPRIIKEWKRGTPLEEAVTIFEGKPDDVSVSAYRDLTPGFERDFIRRSPTFWTSEFYLRKDDELIRIDVPDDSRSSVHREWLYVHLRSDWETGGRTYPAGALLAIHFNAFMNGDRNFSALFEPTERKSLAGFSPTLNYVLLNELDNVRNRLYILTPPENGTETWSRKKLPGVPDQVTASASAVNAMESDDYFLHLDGYLTPPTLALGNVASGTSEILKTGPSFFDSSGLTVSQHEATSADGTRIPYFQVAPENLQLDGSNVTLLYGYGGFEASLVPGYAATVGKAWLEKGGVYVVANIRGGGEFGPKWHQAALKANRIRAYEDFIAVAEDLIRRKVTSSRHLGIMGGSNGGLLMGNMLTMRPDLFGAIVCQVPLLDMKRYHLLLAGASWMAEYGNPDLPEEWEFIRTFSPYHNVKAEVKYPPILFTTSTRDDRVHPAHARKMVAKMKDQGHKVIYYENIEGGHGGAANNEQRAFMWALAYQFLWRELK